MNKANTTDTEAPFLDSHLSIANGIVSSKIYDKRDDFDFDIVNLLNGIVSSKIYDKRDDFDIDIVNLPFLDGDVPRRTSMVYIHFAIY